MRMDNKEERNSRDCIFELESVSSKESLNTYFVSEFLEKAYGIQQPESVIIKRQLMIAAGPIILSVISGCTSGYSAIMLPQLKLPNSDIQIDLSNESWIASLAVLPQALGCILGGLLMELIGRKMCQIISCIPYAIGWILFTFSTNIDLVLVARFITGLISGFIVPPSTVFLGESILPKYRGFLLASLSLGISFGILWIHIMGIYFGWKFIGIICAIMPIVSFVQLFFVPESPPWLAKKNKIQKARNAFYWCRGNCREAEAELAKMVETKKVKNEKENIIRKAMKNIFKPEFYKPLIILSVYVVTSQCSGYNVITFYTVSIMQETVGNKMDDFLCTIIIDCVRMFFSVLACVFIEHMGRRFLTLLSGFGSSISLLLLVLTNLLNSFSISVSPSINLILLLLFTCFVTLGLVPIPWTLVGELFPLNIRSFGSGTIACISFMMMFAVVKTGPFMFTNMGTMGTYGIYATICMIGTFILYFILPETKGKVLLEIEDDFREINP